MQELYSPVDAYKNHYKQLHYNNSVNFFQRLVEKSRIDIEKNRKTNEKIAKNNTQATSNNRAIASRKTTIGFACICIVVCVCVLLYNLKKETTIYKFVASYPISLRTINIAVALVLIALSVLLIAKMKQQLQELRTVEDKLLEVSKNLCNEAAEQMRPLNELLYENYHTQLFSQTVPLVEFDKAFDSKRLDYMVGKFGLEATEAAKDIEQSTLFVQSGEMKGNPFFIRTYRQHTMGITSYTGYLTISWTTTERDFEGNYRTVHHTETLDATVIKPCPEYETKSCLVYASEACDRLSFSREPSYVHKVTEKMRNRVIKKRSKELQRLSELSIKEGGNFTPLGNNEFDALFYAKNRNNESQFRLLFTPLAQQQMTKIFTDNTVGYGDDFIFEKENMINYINPNHLQDTMLQTEEGYFTGINYDKVEQRFIDYHNSYFKHLFFTFAPIFAIPLYTQHQTQEYIYKDLYPSYVSFYEHEVAVNRIDIKQFAPPESQTPTMLKTSLLHSKNHVDTLAVHAWGYRTETRIEHVPVQGGDGLTHNVPVYWTEYIEVTKESELEIDISANLRNTKYT